MPSPIRTFIIAASNRLGIDVADAVVVGDSVWDLLLRAVPAHSAWVSSRAVTAGRSSSALERTGSTTTRAISCVISTRSAYAKAPNHI
jgi:hypothetical protein